MAITFQVGFQADTKSISSQLSTIRKEIENAFNVSAGGSGKGISSEIQSAIKQANILESVLKKATTDKGISFIKMNAELQKAGSSAAEMVETLSKAGPAFSGSLNTFLESFATADRNLLSISNKIKEMQRVLTQSAKFTVAQSAIQFVSQNVRDAIRWVQDLNSEITNIAIVSGKSGSQLDALYKKIIDGARELRVAAQDYAQASTIFYQQGLPEAEVQKRTEITIKAAQAAGQSVQEMSNQLTAVWNTYQMEGEQLERAASIGAKLGAETAIEFRDIATAMQISASAAAQMGVSYESLAAIIATVGSNTRQSASVIGNAYKTIFSRFEQLVSSGTDGEVTLGRVSQQLSDLGIQILDSSGELLPLEETIQRLGDSWDTYSQKQKIAIAEAVGGTRQFGQVLALFNDWDTYESNLASARAEIGGESLLAQYETSLQSIDSAMTNAQEAWARGFAEIFTSDAQIEFYNGLEKIGNAFEAIVKSAGGLEGILTIISTYLIRKIPSAMSTLVAYGTQLKDNWNITAQIKTINNKEIPRMIAGFEQAAKAKQQADIRLGYTGTSGAAQNQMNYNTGNNIRTQAAFGLVRQENTEGYYQGVAQQIARIRDLTKNANAETQAWGEAQINMLTKAQQEANEAASALEKINQVAARRAMSIETKAANAGREMTPDEQRNRNNARAVAAAATFTEGDVKAAKAVETSFKAVADSTNAFSRNLNNHGLEQASAAAKELETSFRAAAEAAKNGDFADYTFEIQQAADQADILAQNLRDAEDYTNAQRYEQMSQELREISINGGNAAEALERIRNGYATLQQKTLEMNAASQALGTSLARVGSSITMLLPMTISLINSARDGNMTASQLISTLAIMAPMIIDLGKNAITLGQSWAKFSDLAKSADFLSMDPTKLNSGLAKLFQTTMKGQGVFGKFALAMSGAGATTASFGATVAAIIAPILAVVAAITALVLIVREIEKTTMESKLDRARMAMDGLTEAADQAREKADALKDSIESYDSAVETLRSCTRGTEEFRDALAEANDQALEVISNLEGLDADEIRDLYNREDGLITFDKDKLAEAQETLNKQANQAEYAADIGSMKVQSLSDDVRAKGAIDDINGGSLGGGLAGMAAGASTGALAGAIVGSVVPVVGNAVGAAVGAAIGGIGAGIFGAIKGSEIGSAANAEDQVQILKDNIDSLEGLTGESLAEKLEALGLDAEDVSNNLETYEEVVKSLAQSSSVLEEKMRAVTEQAVDEQLDGKYDDTTKPMVTEGVMSERQKIEEDLDQWMRDSFNKVDPLNAAGAEQELLDRYNAAAGTNYGAHSNFSRGTDNDRTFAFLDEQGQLVELTAEQVKTTIAASEALQGLGASAEEASKVLASIEQGDLGEGLRNYLDTGNFNNMNQQQLEENFEMGEDGKVTTESAKEYLIAAFGSEEQLNAAAAAMGKSVDEFVQEVANGATDSLKALDEAGQNMSETARKIFEDVQDDDGFKNMSVNAQKSVSELIQRAFEGGGKENADAISDFISNSIEGLDTEEAEGFVSALSGIDWNTVSPEGLRKQLEAAGYSMDNFTNESLQYLIDSLVNLSKVTRDLAEENYNKYNSIGSNLQLGDTLSQEDFDTLTDNGTNGMAEYFTQMRDGTYQLTGDATKFYSELRTQSEMTFNQLAQKNNQLAQSFSQVTSNINSGILTESNIGQSALGQVYGQNIKDAQLAFLNSQSDVLDQEDLTMLAEWNNQLTYSAEDYNALAEMATKYGISLDNVKAAQQGLSEEMAELDAAADASRIQGDLTESGTSWEDLEAYRAGIKQTIEAQEDMEDSSKDFSDSLLENEQAMNEVAKEQARFTQGLQTAGDNMEDWKDIWDDSGTIKDYQKFSDSMEDMRSAYSDLLDVDGSSLSEDFLSSAENMELLETVLTGSAEEAAEALAQLQENAILDLDLDIDTTDLQSNIATVQAELAGLAAGTEITPTVDNTAFFTALNEMIAACGTDMAKIEALCNNLNIEPLTAEDLIPNEIGADVEADTTTVESEGKNEATSYDAVEGAPLTVDATVTDGPSDIDVGSGTIATVSIPTWDYVPKKETEQTTQETPVTSYKIKPGTGVTTTSSNKSSVSRATPPTPTNYRGGSTKPKTGGGGGGGGGSAPKHSAKKASKYDPIKDRYATVKSSIDEVQRSVDALSDAQDDAWGAAKVRNLQKINSELQKQGKNLQQLRKLSLDYLKTDKRDAQIAAKDLITNLTKEGLPGLNLDQVLFNGEGFVSNRTELTSQLDNYLKALYEPYYQAAMAYDRANSTDQAESERIDALKEKYDVAKAFVDEFLAALDLVDETAQEAADALEQQLENIREWMANKVEEATYKMEFQIGINERDISLIEQAIELWGDLGTMMGKTFDQLGKKLREETENFNLTLEHGNRMIEIINNINPSNANRDWFIGEFGEEAWNKYITGNGGLPTEVLDAMQDDADSMIEYMNSMYDIAEEMFGQYIEVLNMYMDEFDKIADKISANNDKLEMFTELLEFSGKKWTSDGRDAIRSIADATVDNAQLEVERAASALELAKQGAEETTAQLEEFYAEHGRDAEGYNDTEAFVYNQLKAAKDEADALLADAQSDMTSSIQDLASAAADAIEMVAEVIKDEVVENLGGDFASFDDMTSMYDQQYDLDTFFLRDFDKEYQLNSLLGEIDNQMENITDPGRLKEYEALIEEINAANQEGVDLTQTDVDLLKAKFEIQKAQDAYEEAQNAKNTMRLARDASGNWNYVYSSDQGETDDAAQALADAQYNYEKLLWEASDEASQYWLQAQQEFFQFQETIDWARYEHDADYKRMIDQQLAYYQQKTELYANQIVKYNGMLDVAFEDTTLGVITNCKDMNSAQEWYTTQHTKYTNDLKQNTKDYQGQVEETCNQVGIKYDKLEETVKTETELMGKENDALREKIKTLNTEGSRALSKLDDKVRNFRENFIQHMEACQRKLEAFLKTLKQMENASINEMYNTGFDAGTDYTAEIHNYIGQKLEEGYTEEQLLADEGLKSLVTELKNKLGSEELYYAGHGTVNDKWGQQGWDFVDKYLQSAVDEAMDYFLSGNFEIWDTVDEWVRDHPNWRELAQQNWGKPPETATGGLIRTPQIRSVAEDGAELILNSDDTKNILSAVAHMRDIVRMKMSSINGTLGKQTSGVVNKTIVNKDIQQVEQQVHIDATFPNVSVASEIEEAFSNLVNQAVQYVSQKNHQ